MKQVIHIYGASGSGTTTVGRELSKRVGYTFMDTDDYFWMPTNPMFTTERDNNEAVKMMMKEIEKSDNAVISGSLCGWGDKLIPFFTLAIRIVTDTEIRIERIKQRELKRFGSRIQEGGDMHLKSLEFIEWARSYDAGNLYMRSKARHDEWEKLIKCKRIILDGSKSIQELLEKIEKEMGGDGHDKL